MSRLIFHVDIDAFFASVEQIDDPSLAGKPVIVGARPGGRGVVATCSYEARAFGIHSAMPISEAWRRCPQGVYLPPRMSRYAEMSSRVMEIFGGFTPDVRQISVDEAFLDLSGTEKLWGPPFLAASRLKEEVRAATGLTISIGCASNHYVAKISSGLRKPDGLVIVDDGEESSFMLELPLVKLWGAGEKTQERFRDLGIQFVSQLAAMGERQLCSLFGEAGGRFLWLASRGRDPGMFSGELGSRSTSAEMTFEQDVADREILESILLGMADDLIQRLWADKLTSRCLALKLRYHDFSTLTRRSTRAAPFLSAEEAWCEAMALLDAAWDGRTEVRLIGMGFADLQRSAEDLQGELFPSQFERQRLAERAVFEIEKRGLGTVTRARLVGRSGRRGGQPGKKPTGE